MLRVRVVVVVVEGRRRLVVTRRDLGVTAADPAVHEDPLDTGDTHSISYTPPSPPVTFH